MAAKDLITFSGGLLVMICLSCHDGDKLQKLNQFQFNLISMNFQRIRLLNILYSTSDSLVKVTLASIAFSTMAAGRFIVSTANLWAAEIFCHNIRVELKCQKLHQLDSKNCKKNKSVAPAPRTTSIGDPLKIVEMATGACDWHDISNTWMKSDGTWM